MIILSSILDKIKNLSQQEIQDLLGNRNINIFSKFYKENLFQLLNLVESPSTLDCELEMHIILGKNISQKSSIQKYAFQLKYGNNLTVSKCSCGKNWKRGNKVCIHVGYLLYLITSNLPLNIQVNHHSEKEYLEQDYQDIKERVELKFQSMEGLDLEPAVIAPILREIRLYLRQLLLLGLQRTSSINLDYLANLTIKAHIAKLANIERQLQSLQETIRGFLLKEDIPLQEFLSKITRIYNFIELAQQLLIGKKHPYLTPIDIIGAIRSEYIPVPDFEAFCIGTSGWITDSGFVGVTLYYINNYTIFSSKFRSLSRNILKNNQQLLLSSIDGNNLNIITLSNVRPLQYVSSANPISIFNLYTPTGLSFAEIAYTKILVKNAKVNLKGQLSLSQDLFILTADPIKHDNPLIQSITYSNWLDLIEELRSSTITPIDLPSDDKFVILEPKSYGSFVFNAISGSWIADLVDQTGHRIQIYLPDQEINYHTINNLQIFFDNDTLPNAIFGKVTLINGKICLYPYTLYYYLGYKLEKKCKRNDNTMRSIFHLYFDKAADVSLLQ